VVLAWVKCANQKWWKNVGALSIPFKILVFRYQSRTKEAKRIRTM
jgi:hypothetical protein